MSFPSCCWVVKNWRPPRPDEPVLCPKSAKIEFSSYIYCHLSRVGLTPLAQACPALTPLLPFFKNNLASCCSPNKGSLLFYQSHRLISFAASFVWQMSPTKHMKCFVLYVNVLLGLASVALCLGWTPETIPNPWELPEACGRAVSSWVCDPDRVMTQSDQDLVEGLIKKISLGSEPYKSLQCGSVRKAGAEVCLAQSLSKSLCIFFDGSFCHTCSYFLAHMPR